MQADIGAIAQVHGVLAARGAPVPQGAIAALVRAAGGSNWAPDAIRKTLFRLEAAGVIRAAAAGTWEAIPQTEGPLRVPTGYPVRNVTCYGGNAAELEECALTAARQFFGHEADLVIDTAYAVDDVRSPTLHDGHALTCQITVYCMSPRAPETLSC